MEEKISRFGALRIPAFRNYISGSFVSEIGNQMQTVAVAWQVYELTGNPVSLGLIGVASFLPTLIFSLFGGLVADKLNRKKLMIFVQSCSALLACALFGATWFHFINPWIIYGILILSSTANSFFLPARQAVLPNLVPQKFFMNAVSLHILQSQTATMIGPAIAGFLIAVSGVGTVYIVNAISFLVFIIAILFIAIPSNANRGQVEFRFHSIVEGIRFVGSTPILYMTMILDFVATFFGTTTVLMPVFAKDILHVGPSGLGLLYSAPAIGGVLAGLVLSMFRHIKNQGKIILASVMLYGFATIGFGFSTLLPLSLFFLFLAGFGDMISTIIRNTIRQMITPDHLRGRMISVMRIFFQGGPQLGEIEAGLLASLVGGPLSVVMGGVGTVLATSLIAWRSKSLREYRTGKTAV